MRYYKRLKNEFLSLSEKVGVDVLNAEPTKKGIRARTLDSLVRIIRIVRAIDDATMFDGPLEPGEPMKWATFLAALEAWVQDAPAPGEKRPMVVDPAMLSYLCGELGVPENHNFEEAVAWVKGQLENVRAAPKPIRLLSRTTRPEIEFSE